MDLKIKPLGKRILVERYKPKETVSGGIILAPSEKPGKEKGTVLAVGTECDAYVSIGDVVLWDKYSAHDIKISDEKDLYIVKADDIIAIVIE